MDSYSNAERCPGLYCGRIILENNTFSDCGACPRGFRVLNKSLSVCLPCDADPTTHDWLYLGFMGMLPLILHWFCIDLSAVDRRYLKIINCNAIRKILHQIMFQ